MEVCQKHSHPGTLKKIILVWPNIQDLRTFDTYGGRYCFRRRIICMSKLKQRYSPVQKMNSYPLLHTENITFIPIISSVHVTFVT